MPRISSEAIYSAASAMNAFGVGMAGSAHNVANVNTAGFQPQEVVYQTGPQGQGVQAQVMPPSPPSQEEQLDAASAAQMLPPEMLHPSGTELAREFTHMITYQRAFEANAVTIRTWDDTLGMIVDMKV